ncbi:MAG: class I SAM-dependent methyltransferase [Ignavibacteria bacterium]|nr:class I SAM-dependent methyltransferase [Ignavibacteria bacterium]
MNTQPPKESSQAHWEEIYSRMQGAYGLYGFQEQIVEAIITHAQPIEQAAVLEIGFGKGNELLQLRAAGAVCTGLDFSSVAIRMFMERVAGQDTGIQVIRADARRVPLREGAFDAVFSQGVLEHFHDPETLLREQYRVLKPGGIMLIEVPNRWTTYTVYKHLLMSVGKWGPGWEKSFSPRELSLLVERLGFETIAFYGWDSLSAKVLRKLLQMLGRRQTMHSRRMRGFRHAIERNPVLRWFFLSLIIVARKPAAAVGARP